MKKCPYCDRPNNDNATICVHCKAALPHEGNTEKAEDDGKYSGRASARK